MVERRPSQPGVPRYVVDASVVARWYLNDERYVERARALRRDFEGGRTRVSAPDHVRYEASNAPRNALPAGRITREEADQAITDLLASPILFVDATQTLRSAFALCLRLNTSLSDALYLTLAELVDGRVVADDQRFRRALGKRSAPVIWLEDYEPHS